MKYSHRTVEDPRISFMFYQRQIEILNTDLGLASCSSGDACGLRKRLLTAGSSRSGSTGASNLDGRARDDGEDRGGDGCGEDLHFD